ncbi:hypothetical protein BPLS_P1526 [Bathymodiolus platifrons methanotrophic gill symbiont]|uniref:hypothetical protein n=1 Tax=Bathymodiolus platifrons methanotrophic gill symbiont TaxID=113268 RepID=UPI001B3DB8EC|nr:hypothetical protein [Bathymodiolus platifrons methanotrophic gill symbiont]GFO74689.1 hypothetical protein BPLS_P1526 [Bathymodiolus platifrons methanotrophic gill symbiont]
MSSYSPSLKLFRKYERAKIDGAVDEEMPRGVVHYTDSHKNDSKMGVYLSKMMVQARHATSRNSGTPVAVIRSPTQRIGDAPAALRPSQTEHKTAQSCLPQMALRLFGIKF